MSPVRCVQVTIRRTMVHGAKRGERARGHSFHARTLASLQCRHGVRRSFVDQADLACAKREHVDC